ncbi:hydrolase, alpha/beta fold family [Pseudovirgaria hyperparasitica]|uniref:Hydrolase, alpha/beta fold family n=1 Tax=Pseudovirgaria hyperparasitica TaxID=470096 RepID=A0A6A6WK76_9PEZI|nr:hydrolase, alpha/beta fold family [Pseudovirgaria hyperparasitica]KAF2762563.1 hydrolase, alpha/beta fold family [Pseudovirgaria hyperparasitica]
MNFLNIAQPKMNFYHSLTQQPIPLKNQSAQTLSDLCKSTIPQPFLNPLLPSPHLQTAWNVATPYDTPVTYKRHVFTATHDTYPGTFTVDFVVHTPSVPDPRLPHRTSYYTTTEFEAFTSQDTKPMLITLHGLSGGSDENYVKECLRLLTEDKTWEACVINSRGCAKSELSSPILYHSSATWDLHQVATFLTQRFPNRKLYGLGFSLGANVLTTYAGQQGNNCVLKGAVVCSNPWNFDICSIHLQRTWIGNMYSKAMLHKAEISMNQNIDFEKLEQAGDFNEFNRFIQCPTWDYPTEGAYYRDTASVNWLLKVQIPLLAIHAEDDPLACKEAIPYQEFESNSNTVLCTTKSGGHLGWYEITGSRWHARAAAAFLNKLALETTTERKEPRSLGSDLTDRD